MAAAGKMSLASGAPAQRDVIVLRLLVALVIFGAWEAVSRSGLFYGEVIPSLTRIWTSLIKLLGDGVFYRNLQVTTFETVVALAIGAGCGIAVGIGLGANRFLMRAFEPYVYYLSPTPRIILFPVMIMWFGVGPSSKIALGALSAFFAIALSTAAGMRQIDPVLIRVGRSFRASLWQMTLKIYLPAMRVPILNGLRLGMGTAIITVLLGETKLSNQGLGYMIMQVYTRFDMPGLYALLIVVFLLAGAVNALIGHFARDGA